MPTPAPSDDVFSQLDAAQNADKKVLTQIVGEHAATQEVQQSMDRAATQPAPAPDPRFTPEALHADNVSQTEHEVGRSLVEVPEGAYSGVVHAVSELGSSAAWLASMNTPQMAWEWLNTHYGDGKLEAANQARLKSVQGSIRGAADAITPNVDSTAGQVTKGITQFAAAFIPISRAMSLAEDASIVAKLATNAVAGGATQAAAFNPDDKRLSDLIQAHPSLANPVNDFLSSQPGDTEAEGRLKNFLEGATLSAASDTAVEGFSSVLRAMRATKSIAENTSALADAKPTKVEHTEAPAEEPKPAETTATQPAPEAPAEAPKAAEGQPEAAPEEPVKQPDTTAQQPGDPQGIVQADTATPKAAPVSSFNAAEAARAAMEFDPAKTKDILGYITDGRYSEIPNMLDDTHRTIPWDQLSDGDNLRAFTQAMEANFGGMIKSAHGIGTVGDEQIVQLAKDIGGDPTKLAATFNNVTDQGGLAAQITAGYNMMIASARRLKSLADIARPLDANSPEGAKAIVDFEKQLEMHAAIVGQVRGSSAEIGRALYAHRALKASSDVELMNVTDYANTVLGPKGIKDFLKKAGKAGDNLSDLNALVDKTRGNGLMNVIKEMSQNGMISGFATQVANLAGNVVNGIIKVSERYLAGAIGQVRGVLMPGAETATIRSAVAHTAGSVQGITDAFPLFVKALNPLEESSVTASGRVLQPAITRSTEGRTGADLALSRVINAVGGVIRYPGRAMGAVDNLNMGIGYQGDLAARSYTQAASEADAKGLVGDARSSFMADRMADLKANPSTGAKEQAMDAGLYQSFQEAAKTRFGEGVSNVLNSHPLVKLLVAPFVHRPLNMLRQSLMDYTALGLARKGTWDTLLSGGQDTDLALARMTIGTSAMAYAYHLAESGAVSGNRLGSKNTQSLDGIPPNSIKIGDTWHQYSRVDPVGLWLSIGSDLHEAITQHYDPNNPDATDDLSTLTRMAVQTVGAAAMDKSFMKSIDQLMQATTEKNPKRAQQLGQEAMTSNIEKFIPFSGLLHSFAQEQDPVMRATGGDGWANIWDSVKKGLPGLSADLPPARDILGRPKTRPEESWWNPFAGATAATDHMDQELSKVAVNVKTPPRQLDGVVLDAKTYDDLVTRSTEAKVFPGGTNLREFLDEFTKSDQWKQYDHTDDNGVMVHTQMVQQAIDAAYDYGKQSFLQAHPDFLDKQRQIAIQKAGHATVPETPE